MRCRHRHRGFALLLALAMTAIVAAAIIALTAATSRQGRRTLDQAETAQIEQLLLAGIADVPLHLTMQPPALGQSWAVELPQALTERDASLHISVASLDGSGVTLLIRARVARRSLEQAAQFTHPNNRWSLKSLSLEPATSAN